jgi:hypothetical protein
MAAPSDAGIRRHRGALGARTVQMRAVTTTIVTRERAAE